MLVFWIILIFIGISLKPYQYFAIGTYGFATTDLAYIGFLATILKRVIWDGETLFTTKSKTITAISLFLVAILFSVLHPLISGDSRLLIQFLKSLTHLYYYTFFFFIIYLYPIKETEWIKIIKVLVCVSIIINLFGIYQIFARTFDLPFAWIEVTDVSNKMGLDKWENVNQLSLQFANFYRATSIFYEPSALAIYNISILSFILVPVITKSKNFFKSKLLINFIISLCFLGLFLTFSLTGVMGFTLLLCLIFLFERNINYRRIFYTGVLIIILLVIMDMIAKESFNVSIIDLFASRIGNIVGFTNVISYEIQGESFNTRFDNIINNLALWAEYPINGFGLGCYRYYYSSLEVVPFPDISIFSLLSETGVIGAITFIAIFVAITVEATKFKLIAQTNNILNSNEKLLFNTLIYLLVIQFQTHFISGNQVISAFTWMNLALILSIFNIYYRRDPKNNIEVQIVKIPLKKSMARYIKSFDR